MPRIAFVCAAAAIGCAAGLAAMNRVGVVFDIDGTLADSFRLGFDATNVVLQRNAFPPISEADYHDNCIYVTPERMARHAVGEHERRAKPRHLTGVHCVGIDETAGFYPGLRPLLGLLRDSGGRRPPNAAVGDAEQCPVNNARGALGLYMARTASTRGRSWTAASASRRTSACRELHLRGDALGWALLALPATVIIGYRRVPPRRSDGRGT